MTAIPRSDDGRWHWVTGLAMVAFAGVAFYWRQRGIHWGGDDADYALLARGLRSLTYNDAYQVGTPPHTMYPPGYPLLLSLWGAVFGDTVGALSVLNILLMLGTMGIIAHLASTHGSPLIAAIAVLLLVTNPLMIQYAGRVLAETPMMFFAASALWLACRPADRKTTALTIVCAVACAMTRTAGVAVILGIGGYWLLRRRFVPALVLAAMSALSLGPWYLWTVQETVEPGLEYVSRFVAYQQEGVPLWRSLSSSLSSKLVSLFGSQLPDAIALPLFSSTRLENVLWAPLSLGAVTVGLWQIGRCLPAVGLSILAYFAVLVVWPFTGLRLLVPVVPALSLAAVLGMWTVGERVRPAMGQALAIGTMVSLCVLGSWRAWQSVRCDGSIFSRTPECVPPSQLGLGRAIRYLEANAPSDAVVMVRRGEVTHFYTGLATVTWPRLTEARLVDPDTLLARKGPDFILVSRALGARLPGVSLLLNRGCQRMELEYLEPPHTLLVAVHPPDTPIPEDACDTIRRYFPAPADGGGDPDSALPRGPPT